MEVKTGNHEMVSRTLHIQAAKVVAAHAASVGDALLGVPLLCSAGALLACCLLYPASCNVSSAQDILLWALARHCPLPQGSASLTILARLMTVSHQRCLPYQVDDKVTEGSHPS